MNRKTKKEFLEELPEPYKTLALKNMDKSLENTPGINLKYSLQSSFKWDKTKQGFGYWSNLFYSLK